MNNVLPRQQVEFFYKPKSPREKQKLEGIDVGF